MTNEPASHSSFGRYIGRIKSLDLGSLPRLAAALVDQLPSGITFGLVGTLGAGKTTFVQSIARAVGVDATEVTSPTFTLLQTHQGQITLHHLDAYRLSDEDEFLELGVDELFDDEDAWTLVEWAERFPNVMPADTLWICIDLISDNSAARDSRQISFYSDDAVVVETIDNVLETFVN